MLSILLGRVSLFLVVIIKSLFPSSVPQPTIEQVADTIYNELSSRELVDDAYIEVPFTINYDYLVKLQTVYNARSEKSIKVEKDFRRADAYGIYNTPKLYNGKYYIYVSSVNWGKKYTKEAEANFKKHDKILRDEINSWSKDLTDLEKLEKINHYIASNIEYDWSFKISDWMDALDKKKGICNAYAELFQRMAILCNLDSRIIISPIHVFNAVKLNKEWRFFDSCWTNNDEKRWFNLTYEELLEKDKIYPAYRGTYNTHQIDENTLKNVLKITK